MRHISLSLFLLLAGAAGWLAGCTDPNPTFVFDAAPAGRDGGAGAGGGGVGGGGGAAGDRDGAVDGEGDAR